MRFLLAFLLVLAACGPAPDPPVDPPPGEPAPPPPVSPPEVPPDPSLRASDYIQWTCHKSKPRCFSRYKWAESLDNAYTQWRGHVDLGYLLVHGQGYLKGGSNELVDITPDDLGFMIEYMQSVNARGDRLIYRILTEEHRNFDTNPLSDWHRSQVRKDVATMMRGELEVETEKYSVIASAIVRPGCDSIQCQVKKDS